MFCHTRVNRTACVVYRALLSVSVKELEARQIHGTTEWQSSGGWRDGQWVSQGESSPGKLTAWKPNRWPWQGCVPLGLGGRQAGPGAGEDGACCTWSCLKQLPPLSLEEFGVVLVFWPVQELRFLHQSMHFVTSCAIGLHTHTHLPTLTSRKNIYFYSREILRLLFTLRNAQTPLIWSSHCYVGYVNCIQLYWCIVKSHGVHISVDNG